MSELNEWLDTLEESRNKAENIPQKIARLAGGWITTKLLGSLANQNKTISDINFSAENFAELIALIYNNRINSTNAQKILDEMIVSDLILILHMYERKGYGK